jgi:hypothetical protein
MKTAELTGAQLDYWVAKAEGWRQERFGDGPDDWEWRSAPTAEEPDGLLMADGNFVPSTDWGMGGPIIEREHIALYTDSDSDFVATEPWVAGFDIKAESGTVWSEYSADSASIGLEHGQRGPTPLIAAMRAYVASKFGDEVPDA